MLADYFTGYHSRNGGGDLIKTDGDLPMLDLSGLPAPAVPVPVPAEVARAGTPVPAQTIFGVSATALRGLSLVSVASVLVGRAVGNEHGPMHLDLVPLAISMLTLLALSSAPARSFATGCLDPS